MQRRPAQRRQRLAALVLESVGALAVLYAVFTWRPAVALALAGVLVILVAQFMGELL